MGFVLKRLLAKTSADFNRRKLFDELREAGYILLFDEARRKYQSVFADVGMVADALTFADIDENENSEMSQDLLRLALYQQRLYSGQFENMRVVGDIVPVELSKEGEAAFIYILISVKDYRMYTERPTQKESEKILEIGFVGDEHGLTTLDDFVSVVERSLKGLPDVQTFKVKSDKSEQFLELVNSEDTTFAKASTVSADDESLAAVLADLNVRQLAIKVRRGGSLLANDLNKKEARTKEDAEAIKQLVTSELLSTEYVVICKKTSNQINRVRSREAIDKMVEVGVSCSCGRPINEERVEELLVPTPTLHRMLNQSFWTTVKLVRALREIGIQDENILLNLREGADEIDAFIDLDGVLLMVELKDNEFSMGHAYPFAGRISQYKPVYALIVSTQGIDVDVKQYFGRVKPEAKIVYVDSLDALKPALEKIAIEIRSKEVKEVLRAVESNNFIRVPLIEFLGKKVNLTLSDERSRPRRRS
jgi:hypothetical protein